MGKDEVADVTVQIERKVNFGRNRDQIGIDTDDCALVMLRQSGCVAACRDRVLLSLIGANSSMKVDALALPLVGWRVVDNSQIRSNQVDDAFRVDAPRRNTWIKPHPFPDRAYNSFQSPAERSLPGSAD